MFCYKCGNQLPDDAEFCNKCGTKLYKSAKKEQSSVENNYEANQNAYSSLKINCASEKKKTIFNSVLIGIGVVAVIAIVPFLERVYFCLLYFPISLSKLWKYFINVLFPLAFRCFLNCC